MLTRRTVVTAARTLAALAARALSPPACAGCDALVPATSVFCAVCAETTVRPHRLEREHASRVAQGSIEVAGVRVVAFASFTGGIADAIRRFKYGDRPDLARPLGKLLLTAARDAAMHADLVVPVPLHPRRLAERGYNQAALLAAQVAGGLAAPLAARALRRVRPTAQQAHLPRDLRRQNVAGAFLVRAPERVRGRSIALVDDVATTGSTLAACQAALLAAGAASVTGLVLASASLCAADVRPSPAELPAGRAGGAGDLRTPPP